MLNYVMFMLNSMLNSMFMVNSNSIKVAHLQSMLNGALRNGN